MLDTHKTSLRLEPVMWEALDDIARAEGVTAVTAYPAHRPEARIGPGADCDDPGLYRRILPGARQTLATRDNGYVREPDRSNHPRGSGPDSAQRPARSAKDGGYAVPGKRADRAEGVANGGRPERC